jgi:sugar lactone lactonase YvrE
MKKILLAFGVLLCVLGAPRLARAQAIYEPYSFATFAGNGPGSTDGTGRVARFYAPQGVAVDSAGNVYVADTFNNTIRKIDPSGVVSTVAGLAGSAGSADGAGTNARFFRPWGVAVDKAGNVYVADSNNNTIRKMTPCGVVTTLAGLAGRSGSADGTASAASFNFPESLAVDNAGNVYVADTDNHTIRKITPSGVVSTLAGLAGVGGTTDGAGSAARFHFPNGVAVDSGGNIIVADSGNSAIRKITPSGVASTLAGLIGTKGSTDGIGSDARFDYPAGVAVDSGDNIYVADEVGNASNPYGSTIRKITPSRVVSTLAGLAGVSGSTDGAGSAARFYFPHGVALDSANNLYVADTFNSTIRKITPSGVVSTLAGLARSTGNTDGTGDAARFSNPYGVAVDGTGNLYVADTGNGRIRKITPSGVVSTLATGFSSPFGVAVDSTGNVYVADTGNGRIRQITPSGVVSTLATGFNSPNFVAVDSSGNVIVSDTLNSVIRKITPSGVVTTLAGLVGSSGSTDGAGSDARFNAPGGVAVDSAGNVFVGDRNNSTIRKITPSGVVSTLAGLAGGAGNVDASGRAARFNSPSGIAVDSSGKVYVGDTWNNTIRVGVPAPPVITSPLAAIGVKGEKFVYQFEALDASSLSVTNLPAGMTFDASRSAIVGISTSTGTFQVTLTATNSAGPTSAILTLVIQETAPSGPVIVSSTSATGRTGRPFQFQVITANGTPLARLAADCPCGLSADPVTGLISGTPVGDGSSTITLTVTDGSFVTTGTLQLTFTSDAARPVIISSDRANLVAGQPFSYQIVAPTSDPTAPPSFSYLGTLPSGLSFDAKTGTISGVNGGSASGTGGPSDSDILGAIQLFGTNSHGTSTFQLLFLKEPSGTVNISTRTTAGNGDNVLIGGFIITGNAAKQVIVRAIAPSLKANGAPLPGALQDPTLELHYGDTVLGFNDNWRDSQENEIIATGIPPTDERESAIIATLLPGNYTAVLRGKDNTTGIAVVEVYDLGTAGLGSASNAQLAQISTRGTVLSGDNVLIGGFIISDVATKVIVRAIGPELNGIVPGPLQDTLLELRDGSGSLIFANDDWRTTQEQQIIDTTVPPKDDRESAIVAMLTPGNYTAIVRGKNGAIGVALVEVYGLQ